MFSLYILLYYRRHSICWEKYYLQVFIYNNSECQSDVHPLESWDTAY